MSNSCCKQQKSISFDSTSAKHITQYVVYLFIIFFLLEFFSLWAFSEHRNLQFKFTNVYFLWKWVFGNRLWFVLEILTQYLSITSLVTLSLLKSASDIWIFFILNSPLTRSIIVTHMKARPLLSRPHCVWIDKIGT